jgi:2-hydroxycyclohexanecarboxyl-CoA dehydrogenase
MLRRSPTLQAPGTSIEQLAARSLVGRLGTPEDVAAACAFLCSEDAGYITGQVIGVNGGGYI